MLRGLLPYLLAAGVAAALTWALTPAVIAMARPFAAAVMTVTGVQFLWFWLPGAGNIVLSPDLGVPLTVLIVIVTVNAVNLVDGLDGLAAGLVAIGAFAYFVFSYRTGPSGLYAGG